MTDDPPKEPTGPRGEVDPPAATGETTAETAAPTEAREPSVEVSPQAFEPQPSPTPPPGGEAPAHGSVDYVPSPIPFDAPTQPTGPTRDASTDDAILPGSYDENALRDAVGAPPARPKRKKRDKARDNGSDDDGAFGRPGSRRAIVIAALAIIVGLAIAALAFLGRANAQRYLIACTTDQVSAEQGRSFPPWGSRPLTGPAWKPVTLPPNAECKPRETEDRAELERWFLDLLVERASTTLTSRDLLDSIQPGKVNPLDVVADQLHQALLLSRAPERRDQRKEVERLLGDVQYWRASLHLRNAAAGLAEAARQFDAAAAQRPRHVTDAAEWATFLRKIVDELHAGPGGVPAVVTPGRAASHEAHGERPSAPLGTALPVEPEQDGAASAEPAAPAPDAGLPTGGVLL